MFIDAKNIAGSIYVTEQDANGKTVVKTVRTQYIAYEEDRYGSYKSITGQKLRKVSFKNRKEIAEAIDSGRRLWESDVNPVFRFLETHYPDDDKIPDLRISIWDIEVDRDAIQGYAPISNPFCPVTSITVYHKWLHQAITIAVPPPNMTMVEATNLLNDAHHEDGYGVLDDSNGYYLVSSEYQLLSLFLDIISETEILSGYNDSLYDLPYIIGRIRVVLGEESLSDIINEGEFSPNKKSQFFLKRLSLFAIIPEVKVVEHFGHKEKVYEIFGRRQVDYMVYYKKFVKAELQSFALDAILELEVGQTKVEYDGSIDQFYRREFRKFLAYNRQDVMGLSAIDDKRKLINLANQMIHMSGVTMDKSVKSVPIIEQAILRILHRDRNEIAWDRVNHQPDYHVPGAFVATPKAGKYGWGASYDASSLYPTMIRLLNISPETMVGQLDLSRTELKLNQYVDDILGIDPGDRNYNTFYHRNDINPKSVDQAYSEAWHNFTGALEYHDVIEENHIDVKMIKLDGNSITLPARDMKKLILQNNWCITANGTIFTLEKEGIIPHCLTKWYNERIEYRKEAGKYEKLSLEALANNDKDKAEEYAKLAEFFDMVQDSKKRFLNSTYGAYLNRFFRFYDARCGRSVTLSGRVVVKHTVKKGCEILGGKYEINSDILLASDTDSGYFSFNINGLEDNVDLMVAFADELGNMINDSFIDYLSEQFLVPKSRVSIVQVKRELVFDRALFKNEKKRYALHVLDKEGKRIPKGHKDELKIVGLEVNRSDTPKYMQNFLRECLRLVLVENYEEEDLRSYIETFRDKFRHMESWWQGSPVRVNNLVEGSKKLQAYEKNTESAKKPQVYWAITAAYNTNMLIEKYKETRWEKIHDGEKIEVLYLRENELDIDRVAIRVGENYVPEWFKELPFDITQHEKKMIDAKLDNIFSGLGWEFESRDHTGYDIFQ